MIKTVTPYAKKWLSPDEADISRMFAVRKDTCLVGTIEMEMVIDKTIVHTPISVSKIIIEWENGTRSPHFDSITEMINHFDKEDKVRFHQI